MNTSPGGASLFSKVIAGLAGLGLLVLGVMFSLVFLAGFAVIGILLWAYLWWKSRALRAAMREQAAQAEAAQGAVIDGEAVVVDERTAVTYEVLPADDDQAKRG